MAGTILHQADENNFPVRAKGLAAEIRSKNPHLVGLQEVALWRTGPCTESPLPPKATHVRYDYLKLLLSQLNRGGQRYRAVIAEPEFDFEVYASTDGNPMSSAPGCVLGSEINGRLTMRDVILARVGRVKTSNARCGHFRTLLQVRPGGVAPDVTRGWTRVDAQVPGSAKFRFVNTHQHDPLGCCLKGDVLTTSGGSRISDFDHKVDHVMTNAPSKIQLVNSSHRSPAGQRLLGLRSRGAVQHLEPARVHRPRCGTSRCLPTVGALRLELHCHLNEGARHGSRNAYLEPAGRDVPGTRAIRRGRGDEHRCRDGVRAAQERGCPLV